MARRCRRRPKASSRRGIGCGSRRPAAEDTERRRPAEADDWLANQYVNRIGIGIVVLTDKRFRMWRSGTRVVKVEIVLYTRRVREGAPAPEWRPASVHEPT